MVRLVRLQPRQSAGYRNPLWQHLLHRVSSFKRSCHYLSGSRFCWPYWSVCDGNPVKDEDWQASLGHHGHGQLYLGWSGGHHSWLLHCVPLGCHHHWNSLRHHLSLCLPLDDPHEGLRQELSSVVFLHTNGSCAVVVAFCSSMEAVGARQPWFAMTCASGYVCLHGFQMHNLCQMPNLMTSPACICMQVMHQSMLCQGMQC